MKHLHPYKLFESVDFYEIPDKKDPVWKALDKTADRIHKEGYGRPIRDLLESQPLFGLVKYGQRLADTDVLFDRWHKLKQKNKVMKSVSFAEKMVMLLTHWESLGQGFNHKYNPDKLPFSKWLYEPQTLYRGMPAEPSKIVIDKGILDQQDFYSFSFLLKEAVKFTSPYYAKGHPVSRSSLQGYVFETEAKPIDFHIFMGGGLSDEEEAVLRSPIEVKLKGSVNMKEIKGKDLTKL